MVRVIVIGVTLFMVVYGVLMALFLLLEKVPPVSEAGIPVWQYMAAVTAGSMVFVAVLGGVVVGVLALGQRVFGKQRKD